MGVGDRIRALRDERGLTQVEVARRLGVDNSTISGYETGKALPDLRILERLAQVFAVPISELTDLPSTIVPAREEDMVPVPVFAQHKAAQPNFAASPPDEGYRLVDKGQPGDCFLRVEDDSMSPQIQEGSLVLLRRQQTVTPQDIAVVVVDGKALIRRVTYADKQIVLTADNRREAEVAHAKQVRIVGKVVEVRYQPK